MSQDAIFSQGEGDRWFRRNEAALDVSGRFDWPSHLIGSLKEKAALSSVLELGCSNGYRLEHIRTELAPGCRCVGVDASHEAIEDGKRRFPRLELHEGALSALPLTETFDLVIVHFVLHWIDRGTLMRSLSEIDRLTKNGGILLIGDFLPDHQQRRRYHHLPEKQVYTYKQDYAMIFEALGTYRPIARITFDHDSKDGSPLLQPIASHARASCTLLQKSLEGFYPEG